jgi:hypothetical protein
MIGVLIVVVMMWFLGTGFFNVEPGVLPGWL